MSDLEEFEAIKQVKYNYQRYVDTKTFEGLAEVLTEDAIAAYDSGKYKATGRKAGSREVMYRGARITTG